MPPGEFEDRQQVEQEMIHARRKVKVYAVLMVLLWAAVIPVNVIVARQNPWAVFVIAGTGAALLIYWLRYRKAVRELRRYQHNTGSATASRLISKTRLSCIAAVHITGAAGTVPVIMRFDF
jgi:Flp pilus assembly protein TadB